jgi:hypothetical protein
MITGAARQKAANGGMGCLRIRGWPAQVFKQCIKTGRGLTPRGQMMLGQ